MSYSYIDDELAYIQQNGSLVRTDGKDFGDICLRDVSYGIDNSLWGITCENSGTNGGKLVKWNDALEIWTVISGVSGVKVSAYNDVSVAVLG